MLVSVYIFDCGIKFLFKFLVSLAGLKTVIGELSHLSSQVTASVSRTITRKLLTAFKNPVSSVVLYIIVPLYDSLEYQSICNAGDTGHSC